MNPLSLIPLLSAAAPAWPRPQRSRFPYHPRGQRTFKHSYLHLRHSKEGRALRRKIKADRLYLVKDNTPIPHGEHPPMRRADGSTR